MSLPVKALTTSYQTVVAAGRKALTISAVHCNNLTGAPVTVTVCEVPSGGAPAVGNAIVFEFPIPANDFFEFGEGVVICSQASLQAKAGSNDAINLKLSYA